MISQQNHITILNGSSMFASKLSVLDELIHETFTRKQSLNEVNRELMDTYMGSFAEKVSLAKHKRKH